MTRNDVDSEVPVEEEVENNQSCQQPDTELPPTVYFETAVSEYQNCADYKIKLYRLKETYRKLKYRHTILRKENWQQMCNSQVRYIIS